MPFSLLTLLSTGVALAPVLAAPAPASIQGPTQAILSAEVRATDYGVDALERIVRGQVAVTHTPDGPRLAVWSLADEPPTSLPLSVSSAAPPLTAGCFDVGVERLPVMNALGGRYGTYVLGGSTATVDHDPDEVGRRVLRLACRRGDGACGLWMHLYDTSNPLRRTYLDASRISRLVFWARASRSLADVTVKAADAAWSRRDDAISLGRLDSFAAERERADGWRRVEVPLDALPATFARDSLAALAFEATAPGESELEVTRLLLCAPGAESVALPPPAAAPARGRASAARALWVWNTREILADKGERRSLLDFVQSRALDRVFLQLVPREGVVGAAGFVPFDRKRLGALVADLRRRGAEVYALDGDPAYALRENHAGVLRTVAALVDHNRTSPPERRFHGVRYDIEPYQLPSFRGSGRDELLAGYLDLVSAVADAARPFLVVGLDIPFWLDAPEEGTGEPISLVWRGTRRPLLEHVLGLVDDVAVMAYRTSAYGADGSLAQAVGEIRAAAAAGTGVYVALETERIPDEDAYGFRGSASRGLPPAQGGPWIVVGATAPGARVWLVPEGTSAALPPLLEQAAVDPGSLYFWRSDPPQRIAADRLSYERLGAERLEAETARLLRELGGEPAFAGIALHHYGALRRLYGESPASHGRREP